MNKNCLLCGVGGQGVVLASKLIAYAAMDKGLEVCTTETIGMAQRGGSVVSHVRMGTNLYSPMIPKRSADVIIAFEPAEAVRNLSYLKEGGIVIVNQKEVKPVTATLSNQPYDGKDMLDYLKENVKTLYIVDGERACSQLGSAKVLNVVLLGMVAASGVLDIGEKEIELQIEKKVKPKFVSLNKKALLLGADVTQVQCIMRS